MSVPERITVAITIQTADTLTAIAKAHPIGSRTSIARRAMELGLREILRQYPVPPNTASDSQTKAAPLGPSGYP
jgi:hypothetical protein